MMRHDMIYLSMEERHVVHLDYRHGPVILAACYE